MDKISFLKNKKLLIILPVALLLVTFLAYGAVKISNQQKRISNLEEDQKTQEVRQLADQQAAQAKAEQEAQKANQQAVGGEFLTKKEDCERRIKVAEDKLASSQRTLQNSQELLNRTLTGKNCRGGDDCYDACVKAGNDKKMCKENYEGTLKTRQTEVQEDKANTTSSEKNLADIKTECEQYLN